MSPEQREIVGKPFEEVCGIKDIFVEKYLRPFFYDYEYPLNGAGVGLSNYNRGRARFVISVNTLQKPTSEFLKSLSLPRKSFKGVPVKYQLFAGFRAAADSRNQLFE
ncbi:hypothetical protein HYW46_06640 [Candidatus Daviesbacteria bacterium]|nr:hypothetical protein [Candidatus Daviesbacteria bacterium]